MSTLLEGFLSSKSIGRVPVPTYFLRYMHVEEHTTAAVQALYGLHACINQAGT
jgi:hypothetical protein